MDDFLNQEELNSIVRPVRFALPVRNGDKRIKKGIRQGKGRQWREKSKIRTSGQRANWV